MLIAQCSTSCLILAPWRVGTVVFLPILVLSDLSLGSKISTCECVSNRHLDPQNPVGT